MDKIVAISLIAYNSPLTASVAVSCQVGVPTQYQVQLMAPENWTFGYPGSSGRS